MVGGAYARDKINIQENASSQLLPQSTVQESEAYFQEITVHAYSQLQHLDGIITHMGIH